MNNIPTGLVTFLFTDIEGSTKLSQEFPDKLQSALEKHNSIMQSAIESNNGFVFEIVGDAFCCSFENADDAIKTAIEVQLNLENENWRDVRIKVRIGIHKGSVQWNGQTYTGHITLARTSRVMSIAHGCQIILTKEVYDSVKKNAAKEISFRDLGKRKLKDIILPEQIYQIVFAGLRSDFPPLKSQDARQNNLPSSLTKFIGRRKEIDKIKNIFSGTRCLTLTGAGGTGKTRLAVQLASEIIDEYEHGVWMIELSPITNPEFVVKEISEVLKIKERPGEDIFYTVKDFLKEKNILLLFDNSEHLLIKCAPVAEELLKLCKKLKIISTSREPFNIHGETIFRIPPLSIPDKIKNDSFEALSEYESIKLFLDRAASINNSFKLTKENIIPVAELCKKLDGIPFAIELASKRINVLPVEKILERLSDRFKLLTAGNQTALPRQKTLRAMIDWSYDLLNFNEQLLLQRLSVFAGGWTLEAAEEICSDDILSESDILDLLNSLSDKSLITFTEKNESSRYVMLETIKEYAMEKLNDKLNDFQKHAEYFLKLTDSYAYRENGIEQIEWMRLIEFETDNIRVCIERAIESSRQIAASLCINMYNFWTLKGSFHEGFDTMAKVIETVNIGEKRIKAELLEKAAQFCYMISKFDLLEKFASASLEISREINYKEGIINSLNALSLKANIDRNYEYVIKLCEEALVLCNEINSNEHKGTILLNLSSPVSSLGNRLRGMELRKEALNLFKLDRNYHKVAETLLSLSVEMVRTNSDYNEAVQYSEESLSILKKFEDNYQISINLINMGSIELIYKKDYSNAEYFLLEAYKLCQDHGYAMNMIPVRLFLGVLYITLKEFGKGADFLFQNIKDRENPGGTFYYLDSVLFIMKANHEMKEYERAAVILGFINFLSGQGQFKYGMKMLKPDEYKSNDLIEKLGEEKFNDLLNRGTAMSFEEAEKYIFNES